MQKESLLELSSRDPLAAASMATLLHGLASQQNVSSLSPTALGPLQVCVCSPCSSASAGVGCGMRVCVALLLRDVTRTCLVRRSFGRAAAIRTCFGTSRTTATSCSAYSSLLGPLSPCSLVLSRTALCDQAHRNACMHACMYG